MKLFIVAAVLGIATPGFSKNMPLTGRGRDTYPLWYDTLYDAPQTSIENIACSTGGYGLMGYGFQTFGDIPTYPSIGGIPMIDGWDSPNCGTCWLLTYTDLAGNSRASYFTAVNVGDQNPDGFITSYNTMNNLTEGRAELYDGVTVQVAQLLGSHCGL